MLTFLKQAQLMSVIIISRDEIQNAFYSAPAAINDMQLVWNTQARMFNLEWMTPKRSNAKISGYHLILQYDDWENSRKTGSLRKEESKYL